MYNDLWNNPYCSNEYPDYTYEEHFGKNLPAFVPRAVVRDYLEGKPEHIMYFRMATITQSSNKGIIKRIKL